MSSFDRPHRMYLFALRNGKKRLAYGTSPAHALEVLSYRLTPAEMSDILPDQYERIMQRDLPRRVHELG